MAAHALLVMLSLARLHVGALVACCFGARLHVGARCVARCAWLHNAARRMLRLRSQVMHAVLVPQRSLRCPAQKRARARAHVRACVRARARGVCVCQ
eukprot:13213980-Alexandrium_andersonii.AAC.1